ncbi:beta-galactosidase GalB [Flavobacterium sp. FlaQc-57]|uniref:beta-galactosidase GalB n=1 Tax=Flavobacterium sp. FlaQc-57 TaxID=3374186 RepID=UPI003756B145
MKKKISSLNTSLTVLFFLLIGSSAFSQNTAIKRMGSTDTQSFDDNWLFSRYGSQPDGLVKEEPKNLEAVTTNETNWEKLNLPHDWAIKGPFRIELRGETGKLPWKGIGWYRKHFTVPNSDSGKQIFVDFDGAMANAKIYLNGKYVGTWPFGYNSFRMNLTPFLKFGQENILAVRLDTENWDSRWYPGAGIYRHVWLVKTNPVHVGHWGTYVTTPNITKEAANVRVLVNVDNATNKAVKAVVTTDLYELDSNDIPKVKVGSLITATLEIKPNSTEEAETHSIINNPKLWDLKTPNRYVAQTKVSVDGKVVDTYNTPFGIRTIEFTPRNGFLLNGKRVEIFGTCNHHDLGALGAAINTSALKRQLVMLKDMGCNSLRTSHNPPAPELLELADKMGFLVWDEAFDAWKIGKKKLDYNTIFDEWHEKDLVALVRRDRNNPSVFIWSIGNEVPDQQNVKLTKELADIVRREDPTRPVSNGYNDPDGGRGSGAAVALDVMGVNYFFDQQPKWDVDPRYKNKPTLGSETASTVSSRGEYFFDDKFDKASWQISSYDDAFPGWGCSPDTQFRTNAKYPHLLGEYVWTGFDYLGEPTPYNSDETNLLNFRTDPSKQKELEAKLAELQKSNPPSRSSYFGIIDLAGFPKDRYYSYKSHWRPDVPTAHILPHWNWHERVGKVVPVHVYTSGTEGELFLNGKSLGRKKMEAGKDFRLTWNDVVYAPGELRVVCYKNGKIWAIDIVKTTGKETKLKMSADRTEALADDVDLVFVTVDVTDNNGLVVPRSKPLVKFSIEGAGEIVATDNGDATSFVPFQSTERPAYNGKVLVIVKAKKDQKGQFTVKAESAGLQGASIPIRIK